MEELNIKAKIEKIVYPGRSLAKYQKKVIFTDEGLPEETVKLAILKDKTNYIQAKTRKVTGPSPHRAIPRCTHYKICSPYQYIEYPYQLIIKKAQIEEMFLRNNKVDPRVIRVVPSPKIWEYRNKAHFHLIRKKNKSFIAYHFPQRHDSFMEIDHCFLLTPQMNMLKNKLSEIINEKHLYSIKEVTFWESALEQKIYIMLYFDCLRNIAETKTNLRPLLEEYNLGGTIAITLGNNTYSKTIFSGKNIFEERIANTLYCLGPLSFFQINISLLEKMIGEIKTTLNLSGKETIADLYSGVGTFGLALSPFVHKVLTVETEQENIQFLEENIKLNTLKNVSIYPEASEEWFSSIGKEKFDILIVDPPRKGIGPLVCKEIIKHKPYQLVYISCNPPTLSRDLKSLETYYTLKKLTIYDFFPHTPHIELCAFLTS
jgi:23S rRNA (uracil-5-)-methyltransferase RumA